jgi:hypothetical protein
MNRGKTIAEGLAILVIVVFSFFTAGYAIELANGVLEPEWSYRGVQFSNHNLMMVFLYGLSAGGIVWIVYKKINRKNLAGVIGIGGALGAALFMACSPFLYAMVPLLVLLLVVSIILNERKKKHRESSYDINSTPSC